MDNYSKVKEYSKNKEFEIKGEQVLHFFTNIFMTDL